MRLELKDAYKHLHSTRIKVFDVTNIIPNLLLASVEGEFFKFQDHISNSYFFYQTHRINKKMEWLRTKKEKLMKSKIKPISYVSLIHNVVDNNDISKNTSHIKVSNNSDDICDTDQSTEMEKIKISPVDFCDTSPLDTPLHERWFVNLSNTDITKDVQILLQLGERFGLPIDKNNFERTLIEFIKHIENNVVGRPSNIINFVRNNSIQKFLIDFITIFRQ